MPWSRCITVIGGIPLMSVMSVGIALHKSISMMIVVGPIKAIN
jgi:hypothetical protein